MLSTVVLRVEQCLFPSSEMKKPEDYFPYQGEVFPRAGLSFVLCRVPLTFECSKLWPLQPLQPLKPLLEF